MKRRVFMGLGAMSIAAGALHSTGAFSSIVAGRGVSTNAAEDPAALVGLDIADEVAANGRRELLTVTNNFTERFEFTIELTGDATSDDFELVVDGTVEGNTATIWVDPGLEESREIDIDIEGGAQNTVDEDDGITFAVDAIVNDGTEVTLSRDGVTVTNPSGGNGGNDDDDQSEVGDEDDAEITLEEVDRSGQSDNRDYSWTTDPEIDDGTVEFRVDGDLIEEGLDQTVNDYRNSNANSGDPVEVVLINADGENVTSASITV